MRELHRQASNRSDRASASFLSLFVMTTANRGVWALRTNVSCAKHLNLSRRLHWSACCKTLPYKTPHLLTITTIQCPILTTFTWRQQLGDSFTVSDLVRIVTSLQHYSILLYLSVVVHYVILQPFTTYFLRTIWRFLVQCSCFSL
jgi:hypothetical protein